MSPMKSKSSQFFCKKYSVCGKNILLYVRVGTLFSPFVQMSNVNNSENHK